MQQIHAAFVLVGDEAHLALDLDELRWAVLPSGRDVDVGALVFAWVLDPEIKRRDAPPVRMCRPRASPHVHQSRANGNVPPSRCPMSASLPTFCQHKSGP